MKKYPYQNLFLKTIKGEKWKDITDLEGYYQISSYGRIKRLEYEMEYKNEAIYLKEEKIIKPTIIKQVNKFKKDHTYFLTNRVIFNKRKHNFTAGNSIYKRWQEDKDLSKYGCRATSNRNFCQFNWQQGSR